MDADGLQRLRLNGLLSGVRSVGGSRGKEEASVRREMLQRKKSHSLDLSSTVRGHEVARREVVGQPDASTTAQQTLPTLQNGWMISSGRHRYQHQQQKQPHSGMERCKIVSTNCSKWFLAIGHEFSL